MRVLLVWPNSHNEVLGWGDLGAIAEPLALEYLGAALEQAGHEPRILDLRLHPRDLETTLLSFKPQMVGVTAFSMHVRRAKEICALAKTLLPACRTVVGGHHATFLPEDFFTPHIDVVVVGEGTEAIVALADAGGREPPPLPRCWRKTQAGHVCGPAGANLDDATLAALPSPARHLVAADRHRYFIDWMSPAALMRTTVGCPYRCTFCSIWKAVDGRYFARDIPAVVEELATIQEDWVFLVDDEAFINGKRMVRLAKAIAEAGIRKRFFTYCRIDSLIRNTEAIEAWRDIGLERLFVGIDAISAKDLDEYNKRCDIAQIEAGLAIAERLGIEIFAQFVVNTDYGHGDFKRLARFIQHHRIRYPSFTVLTPLPGTDLLPDFEKVTARQADGRPDWDLFDCQNAVVATHLPPAEFRREYRNLYHVFKGAYVQYREHNTFIDDSRTPLLPAAALQS